MLSSIDAISSIMTPGTQGKLVAGTPETLAGVDQVLMHRGNGMQFSFELPKEVHAVNPAQNFQEAAEVFTANVQSTSFGHLAQQMVRDVNNYQAVAGEKVRDVLAGGKTPIHEAMAAVQESSVAFQMLSEMRNKLLESYQELNRMQM